MTSKRKEKDMFLVQRSLVVALERAIGSTVYNSFFIEDDDGQSDCLQGGEYACAWFVSCMLVPHNIIHSADINVGRLVGLLIESSTNGLVEEYSVNDPVEPGDVIVWGAMTFEGDTQPHYHTGIALSATEAVSTSYTEHCVRKHLIRVEYESVARPIVRIFRPVWDKISMRLRDRMSDRKPANI